ncbi:MULTISPECIES: hypothetical protein [Staphylococcus]|jgi:hypothetical protein|uniref:DUF4276 family protein n=10 Tax=root TaxID=1 RepID=A0A0H2VGV2_STAES|nr:MULTISPECIES: hypothetical protein [Staphylococcus]MDU1594549.1 hypothetical protein [Staphylococcus lugdunensis]MDU7038455.1 hypothetical protein [Lactococcus lactis]MDU7687627.1 hypothetical protein [Bacillota bacterium]AAO05073.1 conserved hypothetical protein [Staphylococcus epidermidis ATCC 12228]EHQ73108.1 hypothetical protein SEVCU041_1386 [Staphylococcus epidermidis VCU041]
MKKNNKKKSTNCLIICHGKSEYLLANYLKSNLRIPAKIVSDKNGKKSIQINSLKNLFSGKYFKSKNILENHYGLNINENFKIFIIMDTDDCNKEEALNYKNKSMFKNYWFYKFVIPIYNEPNIENVIKSSNLSAMKNKTDVHRIFPIDDNINKIESIIFVSSKLKKCNSTNMDIMFEHLLDMKKLI